MPKQILLSICIPTYNRGYVLNDTLERITNDPEFDDEVEIIISDNCSTDDTVSVVSKYQQIHDNIRYYCNDKNVKDLNFMRALSYGNGEYLKLINDYIYFLPGGLKYMKSCIRANLKSERPLFFIEKVRKHLRGDDVSCHSLDDFIYSVSYFSTWIANFGCWRKDFYAVTNKERFLNLLLMQVDWLYRIVSINKGCLICTGKIIAKSSLDLGKRGGYNYVQVHVANYYKIMYSYVEEGKLSLRTYNLDRKYTLRRYRSRLINALAFRNKGFNFETKNSYLVLWRHYREFPALYMLLALCLFLRALTVCYLIVSYPCRYIRNKL